MLGLSAAGVDASPWVEIGDAQLRSDIEILAAAGVIDDVTMQWPIPWGGIVERLKDPGVLSEQPDYVRDAAYRVFERGNKEAKPGRGRIGVTVDATNSANVVRGFDALGREGVQGQAHVEYLWKTTALRLQIGAQQANHGDRQILVPDGSYIAQMVGGAVVYAGYKPHWWGPGWISSLILSNNARPMPQIGISRLRTTAFESPWLSWFGPWQAEFFVGVLDGPRLARNTIYDGLRISINPLPNLEIGLTRTDMMCGKGHVCNPINGYFNLDNQNNAINIVNDEGSIDIKYNGLFEGLAYEAYVQFMNEDTNPFVHSGTSHLFGGTVWIPMQIGIGRLTVEYASSLATRDIWGGGVFHGYTYNNGGYPDGMRYRDRTLGFSLDSDSTLLSVQASFVDNDQRALTLTYHRAQISNAQNLWGNVVTISPVAIEVAQVRMSVPLELGEQKVRIDIEGRYQDDQPRPGHGRLAAIEVAVTAGL
jgi:hypothetical protein